MNIKFLHNHDIKMIKSNCLVYHGNQPIKLYLDPVHSTQKSGAPNHVSVAHPPMSPQHLNCGPLQLSAESASY